MIFLFFRETATLHTLTLSRCCTGMDICYHPTDEDSPGILLTNKYEGSSGTEIL